MPDRDPNSLLMAVYAAKLGQQANYHDHLCQFCGYGPYDQWDIFEGLDHKPGCVWEEIVSHLKEIGRIAANDA